MSEPVSQRIFRSLKDEILNGVLPPGIQLRQEAVAEKYGVSRAPVREALHQLESEGLLTSELHKGAFVSNRSLDEVEEMLDIRQALEMQALKLAVPRITPQIIEDARKILTVYDQSDDPLEWRDLNVAFHMALYAPCNRPRLIKMIEDVVLVNYRFLRTYISSTVGRSAPQDEHHMILDACAAGDAERALQLLDMHLTHTRLALQKKRQSQSAAPSFNPAINTGIPFISTRRLS
jgi:DNA-binding GntR family transcriptional regulator